MPTLYLPPKNTKRWTQVNQGDLLGELWATQNIDLDLRPGKINVSNRSYIKFSSDDDVNFVYPTGFLRTSADGSDRFWALVDKVLFKALASGFAFALDVLTGTPADLSHLYSDIVEFESNLIVSTSNNLHRLASSIWSNNWWTQRAITSSTNATPIQITSTNHGFITGNIVTIVGHLVNTNANGTWTVTKVDNNNFTLNGSTGNGVGGATGYCGFLNQASALTNSIPHPMDVFNRLLLIGDGNVLHTVDRNNVVANTRITLPPEFQIRCIRHTVDRIWIGTKNLKGRKAEIFEWDGYYDNANNRHPVEGDMVFALCIKNGVPYAITNQGFLMKHNGSTFAQYKQLPVANEEVFQSSPSNRVAVKWKDVWSDQFLVHWNGMDTIEGKIHILLSGAIGGFTNFTLENMPSGIWVDSDSGFYCKYLLSKFESSNKDYGTRVIFKPGALMKIDSDLGLFIAGATLQKDNSGSNNIHGIFSKDITELYTKRGYFITPKIESVNIQEEWDKLWLKFKKLRVSTDNIIIKVKSSEDEDYNFPFQGQITWTNSTTFTSVVADFANAVAGNEVEIILGDGAGTTAHISTISVLGGTYTIVLDESVGSVTAASIAIVRVSKWTKIKTISDITITKDDMALTKTSSWLQFKVELRGQKDTPEIEELVVSTKSNIIPTQ